MNDKKINIIIVGISYFSLSVSAIRVKNLFNPLMKRNDVSIQNLIITSPQMEDQFEELPEDSKIKHRIISYDLRNFVSVISFIINCFKTIKNMRQVKLDNIMYIYGYPDLRNIFIIIFAKMFNYAVVFDIVEDNFAVDDYKSLKSKIRNYSSLFLIKRIYAFANGAIAISSLIKEKLELFSNNKFPVELIPISVDFNSVSSLNLKPNGNLKLFYGGSFGEKDSIDLLLEAFGTISQSYKNLKLVLTGKGAERHLKKLHKLIEENIAKDKIIFKGFLPVKEYFNTINECDILCVTRSNSKFANTGFPFKLGEFLATGKAVIVSDVSDISLYITNKFNGMLVKPDSKEDLVNALETLITNEALRLKIGKEGRKTAQIFFDSNIVSERFFSFIQSVISK